MKSILLLIITIGLWSNNLEAQSLTKKQIDQLSYATGVIFYTQLQSSVVAATDLDLCIKGLQDGFTADTTTLDSLNNLAYELRIKDEDLVDDIDLNQILYVYAYSFTGDWVRYKKLPIEDFDFKVIKEALLAMHTESTLRYNHIQCMNAYQAYFIPISHEHYKKNWTKSYRYDISYTLGQELGKSATPDTFPIERSLKWMVKGLEESFSIDTINGLKELYRNDNPTTRWTKAVQKYYTILELYHYLSPEEKPLYLDTLHYCIGLSSGFGRQAQLFDLTYYKQDFDFDIVLKGALDQVRDTTVSHHSDFEYKKTTIDEYFEHIGEYSYQYGEAYGRHFDAIYYHEIAVRFNYAYGTLLAKNFKGVSPKHYQAIITAFEKGIQLRYDAKAIQEADFIFDKYKGVQIKNMDSKQITEWAYASGINNHLTVAYYYTVTYNIPSLMKGFAAALRKEKIAYTKEEIENIIDGDTKTFVQVYDYSMKKRHYNSYAYGMMVADYLVQHNFSEDEFDVDKLLEGMEASYTIDSNAYKKAEQLIDARLDSKVPSKTKEVAKEIAFAYGLTSFFGYYNYIGAYIPSKELNFTSFRNGYHALLKKDSSVMSLAEAENFYLTFRSSFNYLLEEAYRINTKRQNAKHYAPIIEAGEAFLEKQVQRKEVVQFYDDSYFEVLKKGTSEQTPNHRLDTVTIRFKKMTLYDGKVFEDANLPIDTLMTISLDELDICNFTWGIQRMPIGSICRFYIGYKEAYYLEGLEGQVPPGAAVIYDIELLGVKPY